jgi:hypothetical protein
LISEDKQEVRTEDEFVVYLVKISVAQNVQRRMIGGLINNELESIRKEAVVA